MMNTKMGLFIKLMLLVFIMSSCAQAAKTAAPAQAALPADQASTRSSTNSAGLRALEYYSPLPNALYVSKSTSIILRYGPSLNKNDLNAILVSATGAQSGSHSGKIVLADDQRTVVFTPDQPFTPGEQVYLKVNSLSLSAGGTYQPLNFSFTIATNQKPGVVASISVPNKQPNSAFPSLLTLPKDIPHFSVTATSPSTSGEGDFFLAPFYWGASTVGSYLLILDNSGQIVYYKSVGDQFSAFDFKVLPNGYLSYYDQKDAVHVVMDSHYQVVGKYPAQDGYTADLHDFLILPDKYAILMAYDTETIDMSKIASGGTTNAAVTGLVIQELDPDNHIIFEWRSWDHFQFTDAIISLASPTIDLVHGNGMAIDSDGNLLLSSRNLNEITKINLHTGAIIWRLGGKNSTFQFTNDGGFAYQHDISVLPNGDITLFDNHGADPTPTASRAVEYKLDTHTNTATMVWEYQHTPPVFTDYMGSIQRLPDGNTIIGWGDPVGAQGYVASTITEVTPDGKVLFELTLDAPYVSYRAFRAPWSGTPDSLPMLDYYQNGMEISLGYSWNGATEVAAWKLYDGATSNKLSLVDQESTTGFETQSSLPYLPSNVCYFQVAALDKNGNELSRSAVISTNPKGCPLG